MSVVRGRLALAALLWSLPSGLAWAHKPTVTEYTFHKDVYPIFRAKCGACHREGGVAPMSLLSYKEAYPWAVSIKNEVLNLAMPPWPADERYGSFKHTSGLTPTEMDTIVDWCLGGSPEGEPLAEGAPARSDAPSSTWALGPPALELTMSEAVTLAADENDRLARVSLGALDDEIVLRALDVRPGEPKILRSALVFFDGALAFAWTPGTPPEAFPDAAGLRLAAGTEVELEIQYRKTWLDEGMEVSDASALGIYTEASAPRPAEVIAVGDGGVLLEAPTEVLALLPNVATEAEAFTAELVRPDGSREPILRLHAPSPDFRRTFWLEEPLKLPSGTRIEGSHPLVVTVVKD